MVSSYTMDRIFREMVPESYPKHRYEFYIFPWHTAPKNCTPRFIPLPEDPEWNIYYQVALYFVILAYCFYGVTILTGVFMTAVEAITRKTRKIYIPKSENKENESASASALASLEDEETEEVEVRIWNDTVANLTLMALGTSSPEILLSMVETIENDFEAEGLGPGTIVGSAAFNLLVVTSICMLALNGNQVRRINNFMVFIVTGLFSIFSYAWLFLILRVISVDVVELWEAGVTLLFFPILVLLAYVADKCCGLAGRQTNKGQQGYVEFTEVEDEEIFNDGKLKRDKLLKFTREVKKRPGMTNEDTAAIAAAKLVNSQSHSPMWHRIRAVRTISSGSSIHPILNKKQKKVYRSLTPGTELRAEESDEQSSAEQINSIIEFESEAVAIRENFGQFKVTIKRHGNTESQVSVRVKTVDGTAKSNEDYVAINQIIIFGKNETEKEIMVKIVDDDKWEPDKIFFLKLKLPHKKNEKVELGNIRNMEITIIDDDCSGVIMFEKRGIVVKESIGKVKIPVVRKEGTNGNISVKWRTIDKTAISGKDYIGGRTGDLNFKHGQIHRYIEIPIIDDLDEDKDEHFEVELYQSDGAQLGKPNRIEVTIIDDDDLNCLLDRLMDMTMENIDDICVHNESWKQQIKDALLVKGGKLDNASRLDYFLHLFSFIWKVLFSLIPPTSILGGWPTFFTALIAIGLMTAVIGDLAKTFGCLIGLEDTMTAIIFVALGTSLPDIVSARTVTKMENHADDTLTHLTGSIAVNVLIGVGLPWFAASLYHYIKGTSFVVHSSGLGFSVFVYATCALITTILLVVRRNLSVFGKAEIGGPTAGAYFTAAVLLILWVSYIVLSYLQFQSFFHIDLLI